MAETTTDWTGGNPFLGTDNPYLQKNIDAASADLVKNWNLAELPAYQRAMLQSGSFGNSAVDELTRAGQDTLQKNLGNLANTARMQDYARQQGMYQWQKQREDQNRQWDLNFDKSIYDTTFNQGQQTLQSGIGLLGALAGYNANDLANATTQQNTPLNYWQMFSQGANSIGQGYGTTTGTQGTTSNPLVSMMGGAQLGSSAYNSWRNSGGGSDGGGGITGTGGASGMANYGSSTPNTWGAWA